MPDFIKLPSERVEQLRQLSKNRELSIVDLIGEFVNDQIAKGNLEARIPTIEVRRIGDQVQIDFGTFKRTLSMELAAAYATALVWLATPRRKSAMLETVKDAGIAASGAHLVGLSRQGTSIRVTGENGAVRTLAPSIARDLADIVQRTATA